MHRFLEPQFTFRLLDLGQLTTSINWSRALPTQTTYLQVSSGGLRRDPVVNNNLLKGTRQLVTHYTMTASNAHVYLQVLKPFSECDTSIKTKPYQNTGLHQVNKSCHRIPESRILLDTAHPRLTQGINFYKTKCRSQTIHSHQPPGINIWNTPRQTRQTSLPVPW